MAAERRSESFVWASTGRRLAAARVGRRWSEMRGPLLAAATLGLAQAVVVTIAGLALQETGTSLLWLVPVVALSTLALVAWMGLVRAAFGQMVALGQAPAAKILEVLEASRPALRSGLDAQSARILAFEAQTRLGYGAVAVTDRTLVLAHVGLGADHHGAGRPAPPGAAAAMAEARVTRLPVG
jgi:LytS/YehU family sensor histidine kinase